MTYVETLLAQGERVVRREHQHWFILVWNARWAVGAIVLALVLLLVGGAIGTEGSAGTFRAILGFLTLAAFVYGIVWLGWSYLRYTNEEYVITTRRIIHAEGVINKKATDSSLEKINDAVLIESVFGRMLGYGDLDVLTASEAGIERLRMLRNAKAFKKAMIEAKHELELELTRPVMPPARMAPAEPVGAQAAASAAIQPGGRPTGTAVHPGGDGRSTPGAAAGGPTAPERAAITPDEVTYALDRLGDLRDRGIVTPEEFEAKKRELLDRL